MKTYKVELPYFSETEVVDIIEFDGNKHKLVESGICDSCSLNKFRHFILRYPFGNTRGVFQLVEPKTEKL